MTTPHDFLDTYQCGIIDAMDMTYTEETFDRAVELLIEAYKRGRPVYVMGNGGSAAVADHFLCDHLKGVNTDTKHRPLVYSLCSDMALLTALANDYSYSEIFSKQLEYHSRDYGVVVAMSVSGSSPNIIKALETAREIGHFTIALVGQNGGEIRTRGLSDVMIHVAHRNYGVCEDSFSIIMHAMAQYIRTLHASEPEKLKL